MTARLPVKRPGKPLPRATIAAAAGAAVAALVGILAVTVRDSVLGASVCGILAALAAATGTVARYRADSAQSVSAQSVPPTFRNQVVVSHAQDDLRWARWVAQYLNSVGYVAILQTFDIYPISDSRLRERAAGVLSAASCLLFLITDRMVSPQAVAETIRWTAALAAAGDSAGDRAGDRTAPTTAVVQARSGYPQGADPALDRVSIAGLTGSVAWSVIEETVRRHRVETDPARAERFTNLTTPYPGDGPQTANLPEPNPNFTGRLQELALLSRYLVDRPGPVVERRVALTAMSGMGKTAIAGAFAHRYGAHFDLVWWINAQQTPALYGDLEALAHHLEVPERPDQQERLHLLWARLRTDEGRWLLVYDNAADPTKLVGLLPPDGNGSVLITSQDADWSQSVTHSVELAPMTQEDSLALLRHRTGSPDQASLAAIARRLGHLPLALEQAASYMRESACPATRYLALVEARIDDMLEQGAPLFYDQVAKTTFLMARERAARLEPLSETLLELLSLLAADAIPRDLFEAPEQNPYLPGPLAGAVTLGLAYDAAIRAARTYSLITVSETEFAMHRLVQELIRRSLPPDRLAERAGSVLGLLANAFPDDPDDVATWDRCAELISHAARVLDVAGVEQATAAGLARRVGGYLCVRGAYTAARSRLNFALAIQRKAAGPEADRSELAAALLASARVHFRQAGLAAARTHAQEALLLHEQAHGENSEQVAVVLDELSQILLELSDLAAAHTTAERSLRIRERGTAPDAHLARSHEYLGLVLWRQGAWSEARVQHTRALSLIGGALGPEHGSAGRTHTHLGLVLRDTADGDEARLNLAEREFALAQRTLAGFFGHDHPDTASAGVHHADVLRRAARLRERQGDRATADRLREQAAQNMDRIMGGRAMAGAHPGRACGLARHALVLNDLGEHVTARAKAHEALGIYIQHYGRDHPYVAETLARLSVIEFALRDPDEAIRTMQEAHRIYTHAYGRNHPYVLQAEEYLGAPGRDLPE
jgi:tetratricopeptide (TPR) repeat protein